MLPTYEELIKKMAQEIRLVNLDYLVGTLNPQETLSGSRDLAQAALQGLLENLPSAFYTYISRHNVEFVGEEMITTLLERNTDNMGSVFYQQLLAMRKNDKRG